MDLTDIYRTLHPKAVEYILFKYTGSILQDRSQLSHSKIKNIEILSSMFSTRMLCDQNINYKKNTEKNINM